jgi:Spy/CpxP family protein refolding chaperone
VAAVAAIAGFQVQPTLEGAGSPGALLAGPGLAQAPSSARPASGRGSRSNSDAPGSDGWKWWKDPEVKKALNLTDDRAQKIESLFVAREVEIKPFVDRFFRERERLDRMTNERMADEAAYAAQVSQVETLWARLRESRTVMLYRMFLELQPEQYRKLQEIRDQRRPTEIRSRGASSVR